MDIDKKRAIIREGIDRGIDCILDQEIPSLSKKFMREHGLRERLKRFLHSQGVAIIEEGDGYIELEGGTYDKLAEKSLYKLTHPLIGGKDETNR